MAGCDNSRLLDGGDSVGMTIEAANTEIQKKAEKQIAKINEKLKF